MPGWMTGSGVSPTPATTRSTGTTSSGWSWGRPGRSASVCSSLHSSTGSSASRWPRRSSSCPSPSRSWVPRSSGASCTPGDRAARPSTASSTRSGRASGGSRCAWIQTPPLNTFLMIVILIWLQTGFAMVVLSAAIKGVPVEITEAASLDGANERQKFFRIIVPMIRGLAHHGHDHDGHLHPEDLRHRLRHDRRPLRHGRGGQPDVPADVPVLRQRPRLGAGGRPLRGRAAADPRQRRARCASRGCAA